MLANLADLFVINLGAETHPRIWLDEVPDYRQSSYFDTVFFEDRGHVQRWLFPTEALASQGFPVHPAQARAFANAKDLLTSFHLPRPERKGRSVIQQAGNSMNGTCTFIVLLHSAACWLPAQEGNRTWQTLHVCMCLESTTYSSCDLCWILHSVGRKKPLPDTLYLAV